MCVFECVHVLCVCVCMRVCKCVCVHSRACGCACMCVFVRLYACMGICAPARARSANVIGHEFFFVCVFSLMTLHLFLVMFCFLLV